MATDVPRTTRELLAIVKADRAEWGYLGDVWDCLTDYQKVELVSFAEAMAERNGIDPDDMPRRAA